MTTILTALPYTGGTIGNSSEARLLDDEYAHINRHFQESFVLGFEGKGVFEELLGVYADCSNPDWDGYGAYPVLPETFMHAREFLESMQLETPRPSVSAEPDGHITFDWHSSKRRTLSVSIDPVGVLHYAALLGPVKRYGSEPIGIRESEVENLIGQVLMK